MPVNLHGTDYATVIERLDAAHGGRAARPVGIQSVTTEFLPIGTALLCRATVTFQDGRSFVGSSEVPIDSKQPAERDAPFECAETSAVGRALAMADYPGSDKGLAGAEEIARPPRRTAPTPPRSADPAQDLRDAGAVVRESPPRKPANDAPPREWFAYLVHAARQAGLAHIPTITDDDTDEQITDINRSLRDALVRKPAQEGRAG